MKVIYFLHLFYFVVEVVDEIYDKFAASKMGIDAKGQVVLMIHCGSRGFGHQVIRSIDLLTGAYKVRLYRLSVWPDRRISG